MHFGRRIGRRSTVYWPIVSPYYNDPVYFFRRIEIFSLESLSAARCDSGQYFAEINPVTRSDGRILTLAETIDDISGYALLRRNVSPKAISPGR